MTVERLTSCYPAMEGVIVDLAVQDIRFPTSLEADGSDAIHPDPDYSASYVTLTMDNGCKGYGLAFTIGRGNEIVCHCIDSLRFLVIGVQLKVSEIKYWVLDCLSLE